MPPRRKAKETRRKGEIEREAKIPDCVYHAQKEEKPPYPKEKRLS